VYIAWAVTKNFSHTHPDDQLRLSVLRQQRIVIVNTGDALQAQTMRLLKVDKEHADLRISKQITHRIEHAVTIVTRKDDGLTIDNANKPGIAALLGHGWSALMINARQKEHVAAFNERLMLGREFGEHHARFDIVGKPPCIEAVLQ
jgi:hypothetical protein